jgi:hypothetical protein
MSFLFQHWPWAVGAIVTLSGILFLRRSAAYAKKVQAELEGYTIKTGTLAVSSPTPTDTAAITQEKQIIRQAMQTYPLAPDVQIDVLVNQLADARVEYRFLHLYSILFGSQQRFLRGLNLQNGQASRKEAEDFLKKLGDQNEKIRSYSFPDWVGFLVNQGCVVVGVDSFELTPVGQDFLVWITRRQMPDKNNE